MDTLQEMKQFEQKIAVLRAHYRVQGLTDSELDSLIASYIKSTENSKFKPIYQEKRNKMNEVIIHRGHNEKDKAIRKMQISVTMLPIAYFCMGAGHPALATILCLSSVVLSCYSYMVMKRLRNMPKRIEKAVMEAVQHVEQTYQILILQQGRV